MNQLYIYIYTVYSWFIWLKKNIPVKRVGPLETYLGPVIFDSPLLEEWEADADGHVVDAECDRIPLFWTILRRVVNSRYKVAKCVPLYCEDNQNNNKFHFHSPHTHHGHFIPLDANIRPFEVERGSDRGYAGGIHQIAVMV